MDCSQRKTSMGGSLLTLRTACFPSCFCAILLVLGMYGTAAGFCVAGDVRAAVYWNVSSGMVENALAVDCVDEETAIYLSEELEGPDENMAGAQSVGSLAMGWQTAYGSGITPSIEAGIAIGDANGELRDRISFTIPAGTYDEDIIVALQGWVSGTFTITGDGNPCGRATYSACFGSANCINRIWEDEYGWAFSDFYILYAQLVSAGTTLTAPRIVSRSILSRFSANGQSSKNHVSSGYTEISAAIRIEPVNLPDGVTWVSDSGAFLSTPACGGDVDDDGDVDGYDLSGVCDSDDVPIGWFAINFGRTDCP